jgi:transposase
MSMKRAFKTVNYEQALDLTVRLGDCLPPEHLARFVVDSVALLDLSALYAHYGSRGGEPYAPEVLLGLLFYGYATGVFSSRKIERATYEAVPFRFIAGNQHPDHDTLATFRRTFLLELKDLFVQVLLLAQEAGVLKLGTISLDGTKIHADASRHNAVSYKRLLELETQLRAEIEELFAPPRTERPARHPRWVGGARGDGAARGPLGTTGGGQSSAASACHRARGSRAGGV